MKQGFYRLEEIMKYPSIDKEFWSSRIIKKTGMDGTSWFCLMVTHKIPPRKLNTKIYVYGTGIESEHSRHKKLKDAKYSMGIVEHAIDIYYGE
jgi:hypothetical protein